MKINLIYNQIEFYLKYRKKNEFSSEYVIDINIYYANV